MKREKIKEVEQMKKIIFHFIFIIIFSASLNAGAGSKSAEFILFGVGGRPLGLGGAYTAMAGDIYSVHWNPAGLAGIRSYRVAAMHTKLPESVSQQFITLGFPVGTKTNKNQYIALSLNFMNYGEEMMTIYVDPGDANYFTKAQTGRSFDGSDMLARLSYAYKKDSRLSLGMNLKYISQNIYTYNGSALGIDAGIIYKLSGDVNLGAGLYNFGTKLKMDKDATELPQQFKTGLSANVIDDILLVNGDIIYTRDENMDYALGAEFRPVKIFALRGGYNSINEAGNGFTFGFGMKFNKLNFDYAYEFFGDFDASHKFSLDYEFGTKALSPADRIEVKAQPAESIEQLIKEGYVFILDGNYFNAMFKFREAAGIDPYNVSARLWLAYSHTKLGNINQAVAEYRMVLQIQPNNRNALTALRLLQKKNTY